MRKSGLLTLILAVGAFTTVVNGVMLGPILERIAAQLSVSEARVGQLATLHALIAAIVGILAAPLLDRYGRRAVLRFECAVLLVGTLLSALAPSFGWLLAGRAVAGVGGAVIFGTSVAAVGDFSLTPAERNQRIGFIATAAGIGAVIGGPALAEIAAHFSWHWSFAALLLPVAIVLAATWLLPPPRLTGQEGSFFSHYVASFREIAGSRPAMLILASLIALFASWGGFTVYVGAYVERSLHTGTNGVSLLYFVVGLAFAVTSTFVPRLLKRVPARRAYLTSAFVVMAMLLLIGSVAGVLSTVVAVSSLAAIAMSSLILCSSILLLDALPTASGALMSLQSAMLEVGVAGGAAVGGGVLALTGSYPSIFHALALAMPLAAALVLLSGRAAPVFTPSEADIEIAPTPS